MTKAENIEGSIDYAKSFRGDFYSWGGDSPAGFDCSGFVCEILKRAGLIERKSDYTAQGLWDIFKNNIVNIPYAGCLVFYYADNDPAKAIHVELLINDYQSIGASGGGSKTTTREDAIRDNAFIKERPFNSRSNIKGFLDPFMRS